MISKFTIYSNIHEQNVVIESMTMNSCFLILVTLILQNIKCYHQYNKNKGLWKNACYLG